MRKLSQSKLTLVGSAFIIASTSCSTLKLFNNSNVATNATTNPKQSSTHNLEQRLSVPDFNMDSILISNLADYRPEILEIPRDIRVVGGDSLDLTYERPESIDSSVIEHNLIVRNNAIKKYPENKFPRFSSYLGMIFKACDDYRTIFKIPSETVISLLAAESGFNPFIISIAPAFGIGQFMRETAIGLRMNVYSEKDFPNLYKYETELAIMNKQCSNANYAANLNFHNNNFDLAKMYELKSDSLVKTRQILLKKFENELRATDLTKLKDDRLVPNIAIPHTVQYLASLARQCKKIYHCSDDQALSWAIEAYNAGLGSISYSKPVAETSGYARGIHKNEAQLFPYTLSDNQKNVKPYVTRTDKIIPSNKPPRDFLQSRK